MKASTETSPWQAQTQRVKSLPETVPVVVGAHQAFVTQRQFLASGPQLPPFFGPAEIDIRLAHIQRIPKVFALMARARTKCSGILSLQEKLDPRRRLNGNVEAEAV